MSEKRPPWGIRTRPIGKGMPVKGNRGGCVYTPNNQMAEALVACLTLAREMGEMALGREIGVETRDCLLSLEDRMDDRVFELTGVRYKLPDRRAA